MRITISQGAFLPVPPLRGGAVEKMWYLLGQEFVRKGHEVTHISRTFPDLPVRENIAGVEHRRVRGYNTPQNGLKLKGFDLLYSLRVRNALPLADLLVTNTFWLPMLFPKQKFGALLVDVQRMPKGQMHLYRHAACLRANSRVVESAILSDDPKARGRTTMIPNPLTFIPSEPVDWSAKKKIILYAGRIHPEKGIALLLEAFALGRLEGTLNNWELRLVGPWDIPAGGGGEAWKAGLMDHLPQNGVSWIGPIYDSDTLNHEYQRASVFAYPSLAEKGETFGLAPLEAMAWGALPVVSSLACFQDFIQDGYNGMVFDHRSAHAASLLAETLKKATALAPSLAPNTLTVRETHSVAAIATQFLEKFVRLKPIHQPTV